jgi:hypothetical protein
MKYIHVCLVFLSIVGAHAQQPTPTLTAKPDALVEPGKAKTPAPPEALKKVSTGHQTAPQQYVQRIADWRAGFWQWRINFWSFSILGIVASAVVASKWRDSLTTPLSILAAICTALLALFNSGPKSRAYGHAEDMLQTAVDRYEAGYLTEDGLLTALEEGRKLIGLADQ